MATSVTATRHEKLEWARCAQAMYAADCNMAGHKLSTAAAIPEGGRIDTARFDLVNRIYREWLAYGIIPATCSQCGELIAQGADAADHCAQPAPVPA